MIAGTTSSMTRRDGAVVRQRIAAVTMARIIPTMAIFWPTPVKAQDENSEERQAYAQPGAQIGYFSLGAGEGTGEPLTWRSPATDMGFPRASKG